MSDFPFEFDRYELVEICESSEKYPYITDDGQTFYVVSTERPHGSCVYTFKHVESDRLFQVAVSYDSWEGLGWSYVSESDIREVKAVQKLVTVYEVVH